jgi:NTE family protein
VRSRPATPCIALTRSREAARCAFVTTLCLAVPAVPWAEPGQAAPAQTTTVPANSVQVGQPAQRPRIGLALGGGSARGIAHIGVLEWFERHRVPIDVIAGTSMGGLVAGAYASGMTPAEIRQLLKDADWDLMFLADSPFRYKTFRRKQDKRAYPSLIELGLRGGISLPGGLNPGQQVSLLFDRIALPYYDVRNFDDLPTPFRCVATDLRTAEVVVLGRGPFAQALRATMAIPGVFTPVNLENWLLVDGGTLNNVPADVVKQMGADVVFAVNVGADPVETRERQQTMFGLLGRTIDTMMTSHTRRALNAADLVIDPDLKGLNSMDWRRTDDLADRGYQAADRVADKLQTHALSEAEHAAHLANRQARRRTEVPVPSFVRVTGVSPREERAIQKMLAPLVGQNVDPAAVAQGLLTVQGTDRYEYLTYRIVPEAGGAGLLVNARPKSYGPPFLALGLELSNVDSSSFAVNLGGRVIMYGLTTADSEARLDVVLGTRQLLGGELVQPLGGTAAFIAPRLYFDRTGRNSYVDEQFVAEYRFKRTGAGLDAGYTFGRGAELRLGVDAADVRGRLRIGDPDLPEVDGTEAYSTLQFIYDGQTSPIVPTRGTYARASLRYFFLAPESSSPFEDSIVESPQTFWQGEITGSYFRRVRTVDRLFARGAVSTSFGSHPLVNDFGLGGPLRLGAFNNDELRGDHYYLAAVGYLKGIGRLPDLLGGPIYAGGWLENGDAFNDWDDVDARTSVTIGLIAETLLGPVFGGASVGFDGRTRFYIAIGPLFR